MFMGGTPTVSVKLRAAGLPGHWLLVACTVKLLCVPAVSAVGVPEMTPAADRARPAGSPPDFSAHDQVPPLMPPALSVWLYWSVAVGALSALVWIVRLLRDGRRFSV